MARLKIVLDHVDRDLVNWEIINDLGQVKCDTSCADVDTMATRACHFEFRITNKTKNRVQMKVHNWFNIKLKKKTSHVMQ